jgi:hypothetical protein
VKLIREAAKKLADSKDPKERALAEYLRTHDARLRSLLADAAWAARGTAADDRDELEQVALLACWQLFLTDDPEVALRAVDAALHRHDRAFTDGARRHLPLLDTPPKEN